MKKLIALLLALVMCLSLVACGGDTTDPNAPVIDAFNAASDAFANTANAINEDIEAYPQDLVDLMMEMSSLLSEYKTLLESGEALAEADAEAMIQNLNDITAWSEEVYAGLGDFAVNGDDSAYTADNEGTGVTDEQIAALAEAYNTVAPLYNEAYTLAEANGWLADELTATEVNTVGATLGTIGQALTEDISMLEGADVDALPAAILEFAPALEDLITRVSAPYEG